MNLDRIAETVRLCRDKSVLHLGFVQHRLWRERLAQGRWLHARLAEVARHLVGFDYLDDQVEILRTEYDYECYPVNVEQMTENILGRRFDVVVCGELIEHLSNPGAMLEGVKHYMHDESQLVVTTPNPFSLQRIDLIRDDNLEENWLNPEHTVWFSFQTLKQLLHRHGYREIRYTFYDLQRRRPKNLKQALVGLIRGRFWADRHLKDRFAYNHDGLFFVAAPGTPPAKER